MRALYTDFIPETFDFLVGKVDMHMPDTDSAPHHMHHQRTKKLSVSFSIDFFEATPSVSVIRNDFKVGEIKLTSEHISAKHSNVIRRGLIHSVKCCDENNTVLKHWNFNVTSLQKIIIKENYDEGQWKVSVQPCGLYGQNLVPLIPIGAIWKATDDILSLQQAYAIVSVKGNQLYWSIMDDDNLQKIGFINSNHAVYRGQNLHIIDHVKSPRPSMQDINISHVHEDIETISSPIRIDPIDPDSLTSTIYF